MELTSLACAGFIAAVFAVFQLLPPRPQLWWLLLASYVFYATWAWPFALLLAALTAVTFVAGHAVRRDGRPRRGALLLGVGLNIGALVAFKSGNVLLPTVSSAPLATRTLLPVGLSFYTLQAVSYLIDVARAQIPAASNPVAFALYLAYFPKLLAGPIERARTFLPQLSRPRVLDDADLARAGTLIAVGLVRKIVIADSLQAMIPAATFHDPASGSGLVAWLIAYSFALYNDFAGYTSLVRGISLLFGIELSPNFAAPYFARSIGEFWARWHITLSQWLRDYVYLPISRALLRRKFSRWNVPNLIVPPLLTMLVCGAWHGEGWNFLLWGGIHGLYLSAGRALALWRPQPAPARRPAWRQALAMLVVFVLVTLTLIPFRMPLPTAAAFVRALATPAGWALPDARLVVLIALTLWIDTVQARRGDELVFLHWPRLARAALLAAAMLAILLASQGDTRAPFVYQRF